MILASHKHGAHAKVGNDEYGVAYCVVCNSMVAVVCYRKEWYGMLWYALTCYHIPGTYTGESHNIVLGTPRNDTARHP